MKKIQNQTQTQKFKVKYNILTIQTQPENLYL